jgi:outer membrane immunogenic protein
MRRIVFSAVALASLSLPVCAADLPPQGPVALAPAPVYDWTGLYLGAQIGGEFGTGSYSVPLTGASHTISNSGVFGGGFAGYSYQINSIVLGLQGEFNGSGVSGSVNPALGDTIKARQEWLASIDGRLGYGFNQFLVYAIGGVAFSELKHNYINRLDVDFGFSNTRTGFDVGGGVEYALTPNWTARLEYRYYDFGETSYAAVQGPFGGTLYAHNLKQTDNSVRIGLAYKFGAPAVVAKY